MHINIKKLLLLIIISNTTNTVLSINTFGGGFLCGTAFQSIPPISWWMGTMVIVGTHYSEPVPLKVKAGFTTGVVTTAAIQAAIIYLIYKGFKSVTEDKQSSN